MDMNVVGYVMNLGNTVLFLVIEADDSNRGDIQNKYLNNQISLPYEQEAIKCVTAWRKYGPNIPIKIICVNSNPPSKDTINKLEELDCEYHHWRQEEADQYKCGYWNVPLAGHLLEQSLIQDSNIIHIDLDMTLFRPLDLTLFENAGDTTRIAINEFRPTLQNGVHNIGKIYDFEINTGFIYSNSSNHFYKDWYERLKNKTAELEWDDPNYSIWEERICDIMYFEEGYPFTFFKPFQINGSLSQYSDEQLSSICFNHCHINHTQRAVKQLEEYLIRCR